MGDDFPSLSIKLCALHHSRPMWRDALQRHEPQPWGRNWCPERLPLSPTTLGRTFLCDNDQRRAGVTPSSSVALSWVMNCALPKLVCWSRDPWYLWLWPYLTIGLVQVQLGKMRSAGSRWAPNPIWPASLQKEEIWTPRLAHRRAPCKPWNCVVICQEWAVSS